MSVDVLSVAVCKSAGWRGLPTNMGETPIAGDFILEG